jgi:DNA-binding NarL/FixJ family response regulator
MRPTGVMRPSEIPRNEVLVIDSRRLRQASLTCLLGSWADASGLTVKAASPDAPLDKCGMIIISVGTASIQDAEPQLLIKNFKTRIPEARLVIISDQEDAEEASAAFHNGAAGFLPTSIEPELALRVLSFIRDGGSFFPPSVLSNSVPGAIKSPVCISELTSRQEQVFRFLRQGYSNKAIARQLGMSEATVKVHTSRLMRKFGVTNRTQLAVGGFEAKPIATGKGRQ